jgi:hypothetical protein
MQQAAERFKREHNTHLEPEVQWAKLTGADAAEEWRIAEWGHSPCSLPVWNAASGSLASAAVANSLTQQNGNGTRLSCRAVVGHALRAFGEAWGAVLSRAPRLSTHQSHASHF